jgi:Nicotinate phosphoribosyltransferase (NAPRTase) family
MCIPQRNRDPRQKLFIASDSLDVDTIWGLHAHFSGTMRNGASPADFRQASDFLDEAKWIPEWRIRFSAGWGTLLTNDFRNCDPQGGGDFDPVSLVCKLNDANGKPAVKLSDNFQKALGPREEIQRYQLVFGLAGVAHAPVVMSWQRGSGTAFEEIGARAAFSTTTFPRSGLLARSNFWIARDTPRESAIRERSLRLHAARASALQKGSVVRLDGTL